MSTKRKNIVIAIDGYSSTGKSTLAKNLAKELGYVYVDTGAMYRAVALYAMRSGLIKNGELHVDGLINSLDGVVLDFAYNPDKGFSEIYLNGEKVEGLIRSLEVSNQVSQVARIPQVRKKLVVIQQDMAGDKGIVMDGRDIGTVVFPEAELKLFLTASAEKRAQRRYKEMVDNGISIDYDSVLENVTSRDHLDTTRSDSPLIKADDAVEIDNSDMSVKETYELAMNYVEKRFDEQSGT